MTLIFRQNIKWCIRWSVITIEMIDRQPNENKQTNKNTHDDQMEYVSSKIVFIWFEHILNGTMEKYTWPYTTHSDNNTTNQINIHIENTTQEKERNETKWPWHTLINCNFAHLHTYGIDSRADIEHGNSLLSFQCAISYNKLNRSLSIAYSVFTVQFNLKINAKETK